MTGATKTIKLAGGLRSRTSINADTVNASTSALNGLATNKVCFSHNFDKKLAPKTIKCIECAKNTRSSASSNINLIQCSDCHQFTDIACAKISSLDFIALMKETAAVWFCRSCQNNDFKARRMEQIEILRNQFTEFVSPLQSAVNSLISRTGMLDAVIPDINHKIVTLESQLKKCITQLNHIQTSSPTNNNMDRKFEQFEKLVKASNLILRDIPIFKNEDVNSYVLSAAKTFIMALSRNDIDCFRLQQKASNHPPVIIVKFHNINVKNDFYGRYLDSIKQHRYLTLDGIQHSKSAARIYFNQHLTTKDLAIFNKARKMVRDNIITQVFTSNGNVYIRVNGTNDRKLKIGSLNKLEEITASRNLRCTSPEIFEGTTV